MVDQSDILWKLADLHKQATVERSHYYVASVVRESVAEITGLRQRLGKIAHAPVPADNKIAMTLKRWAATNPGEIDLPDPYSALRSARALITAHRDNDLECFTVNSDPATMDEMECSVIAEYEDAISKIDAALATRTSEPTV